METILYIVFAALGYGAVLLFLLGFFRHVHECDMAILEMQDGRIKTPIASRSRMARSSRRRRPSRSAPLVRARAA